ncbi:hypothetical protein CISIN_1g041540mg [Citrus sinensis]|uniref:EXS domain-containing protein n=1 Tax=Citrus sinensis TaxID=2711 RepID=A0A067DF64_CITSI|nr:hypothetical protein CISIN_1g041540mg [Citrus sinensis]
MVPEWQEAFMNYDNLKTLLKEVRRIKQRNKQNAGVNRAMTLCRAFSGLVQGQNNNPISPSKKDIESQYILVNSVTENGFESYETTFLQVAEEGGECEQEYFRKLDEEFNKVEKFSRTKVKEAIAEAESDLFAFIVLHMLMYAVNVYFWRRCRVNYPFIFNIEQGTELGYREVLLVSFGLATFALTSVLSNLDMEMDPKIKEYKALTELLPLGLVLLVIVILICPFNIIFRSSRFFFLASLFHCIAAPLHKVTLQDFFMADQLTSQVQAIRSLGIYICYYGWGDFKRRRNTCHSDDVYNTFYFIVAVIPYWFRFLQCLRRLYEEKDPMQGYNGLKYFVTIIAISTRTACTLYRGFRWKLISGIFSAIATIYGTYWDLVVDWGLLQRQSRNRWLRDKLLVPRKSVYFSAMILNVLLRFDWLQTVLLENEHLNNVGKYRAFKSVPLPFSYCEDEEEHDD